MRHQPRYKLLTFYKFIDIPDPEQVVAEHRSFCLDLGLRGRVYIGDEGISSTVTGNEGQIIAYKLYLESTQYFQNIPFIDTKANDVDGHKFDRMAVKYRPEIVTLGKKYSAREIETGGNRMDIADFKKIIDEGQEDYVVLDMRNDYEYRLGHFKNAVPAGTVNFRDLENVLERYKQTFPDKKIITYCTGGIRCEKATVMMREAGLEDVFQLDGWVVQYTNTFNDGNWLGNLYTFDGRVSTQIGDEQTHSTIGRCLYTDELTDNCENCRYAECNARLIATKKSYKQHMGFCSRECYERGKKDLLIKVVVFDPLDYKQLGREIRQNPEKRGEILEMVGHHLDSALKGVVFQHQVSQKEGMIEEC